MNRKRWGRKWSRPNFRLYPAIYLDALGKTTKNFSQGGPWSSRDSNRAPSERKAEALPLEPLPCLFCCH